MRTLLMVIVAGLVASCAARGQPPPIPPAEVDGAVEAAPTRVELPAHIAPDPDFGRLRLRCDPPDAEVLINGVTQGIASDFAAPESLKLEPGLYRIEIRQEGYSTFRAEVVISPEVMETVPVRLSKLPTFDDTEAQTVEERREED